jgi:uncharacterized membrane protein YbhN (UPF0104 family)
MRLWIRIVGSIVSLLIVAALLVLVLPRLTGVNWDSATDELGLVPLTALPLIVIVWASGLSCHMLVLRGALPGLTLRQAWALNLGGSGISNVLPFGGAAGVGLNVAMLRSWGFRTGEIGTFAALSNGVALVAKVLVAAGGVVALVLLPDIARPSAVPHFTAGTWAAIGAGGAGALALLWRLWGRRILTTLTTISRQVGLLARKQWPSLAVGGLAYPITQVLLLGLCLHVLHVSVPPEAVLTAYAVERLSTLIPLTPGGVGVVETTTSAVLLAFGADPAAAVAAVLLFRVFTFAIEIPLGAIVTAAWLHGRRRPAVAPAG